MSVDIKNAERHAYLWEMVQNKNFFNNDHCSKSISLCE